MKVIFYTMIKIFRHKIEYKVTYVNLSVYHPNLRILNLKTNGSINELKDLNALPEEELCKFTQLWPKTLLFYSKLLKEILAVYMCLLP